MVAEDGLWLMIHRALATQLSKNPFYEFYCVGLNVSLSTDDPLMFHHTKEPLMEEYSVAKSVYGLSITDVCEIARNSVLQSGFSEENQQRWLGTNYNTEDKTNVPMLRMNYRRQVLRDETHELYPGKKPLHNPKRGDSLMAYNERMRQASPLNSPMAFGHTQMDLGEIPPLDGLMSPDIAPEKEEPGLTLQRAASAGALSALKKASSEYIKPDALNATEVRRIHGEVRPTSQDEVEAMAMEDEEQSIGNSMPVSRRLLSGMADSHSAIGSRSTPVFGAANEPNRPPPLQLDGSPRLTAQEKAAMAQGGVDGPHPDTSQRYIGGQGVPANVRATGAENNQMLESPGSAPTLVPTPASEGSSTEPSWVLIGGAVCLSIFVGYRIAKHTA